MTAPVSILLSGPALSLLLYEQTKSKYLQEGFLLGDIIHNETTTITDHDKQQVNVTETIKIHSVIPCMQSHYFYNGKGEVDIDKVKRFLGNRFDKVVAWYKYQKRSSFKFTLRDKIIHRQLSNLFGKSPELFLYCRLLSETCEDGSAHLFTQAFVRYNNDVYDQLPMNIRNLSEPSNVYKQPEPVSENFKKILNELKTNNQLTKGVVGIGNIQNALQKHIELNIEEQIEEENLICNLEKEIQSFEVVKKLKKKNAKVEKCNISEPHVKKSEKRTKIDSNLIEVPISTSISKQTESKKGKTRVRGRGKDKNPT